MCIVELSHDASSTHWKGLTMKLTIDGTEYEYEVRYINNRAVAIGYRADLAGADLSDAFGLSTVTGEPASLPDGWEYTEGKGIHKADAR